MCELELTFKEQWACTITFQKQGADETAMLDTSSATHWVKTANMQFVDFGGVALIHLGNGKEVQATFGPFDITEPVARLIKFSDGRRQARLKGIAGIVRALDMVSG